MKTPILGQAYVAKSINAANDRMINLFLEMNEDAGKEPAVLYRCPGLRKLATIGNGPIRGVWPLGDYLYVVSGVELYRINRAYVSAFIGYITGDGPVSIADNGTQIFFACNPDGFIYNTFTNEYAQITDEDFPGAQQVGYLNGYFVFTEPNSQKFWITELLNGTAIDPTDFASAEGFPDNNNGMIIDHLELWLFGTTSQEVWYDAALEDFPLSRIQGAFNEIGCCAPYSVAKMDNGVFWLGGDARGRGMVFRADGYRAMRVSTFAIEQAIQSYGNIDDAVGYCYQQNGHFFYVLSFPTGNATWVYDATTGKWHERLYFSNGEWSRHRSNCYAFFNGLHIVGDYEDGRIYALDLDYYLDDVQPQRGERTWRALGTGQNNLQRKIHRSLQLDMESGVGLNSGQGQDPQIYLSWSDDAGHNWSDDYPQDLGEIGEFGDRVIWFQLGVTKGIRDRVYKIWFTDPVPIAINGAELNV